jgi:hypothetical protein
MRGYARAESGSLAGEAVAAGVEMPCLAGPSHSSGNATWTNVCRSDRQRVKPDLGRAAARISHGGRDWSSTDFFRLNPADLSSQSDLAWTGAPRRQLP